MKALLLVFGTLILFCTGLATVDQCHETVRFEDSTCSPNISCPPSPTASYCTVTNFTPQCDCDYVLDAWTECGSTNCAHCMSCAAVYDGTTLIASCDTRRCTEGSSGCCNTCGPVALTAGHTYDVVVCLTNCTSLDDCSTSCSSQNSCQAFACLRCEASSAPCHICS